MLVFRSVEEDELVGEEVLVDDCEFEAEAKRFSSIAAAAAGVAAGVTGSGALVAVFLFKGILISAHFCIIHHLK